MSMIEKLCRLCGEECVEYVNIYDEGKEESNFELDTKIASCLRIQVSREDILPKRVCRTCSVKLDDSFDFFQISNKTQSFLEELFDTGKKNCQIERIQCEEKLLDDSNYDEAENEDDRGSDSDDEERPEVLKSGETRAERRCSEPETAESELKSQADRSTKIVVLPSFETSDGDANSAKTIPKKPRRRKKDTSLNDVPINPRRVQILEGYPWSCTLCEDRVFDCLQDLKEHYKTIHKQPPVFKCISCEKQYDRYRSFSRHIKMHGNPNKYTCDICGKSFNHKTTIQSHAIVHTNDRPHVCQTCGKSFKNLSSLNVHEKKHLPNHTKQKYPCDVCQKEFSTKHTLENHKYIHTGVRGFVCDICGRSFYAKASLDYHLLSHNDDKKYVCSTCNKGFRTPRLLEKHTTLHTGIKPHQCDVCGRQFRERSALREHNRIHTGDMPYTCEVCGKSFRFKGILTVHMRQHTGERPYACLECRRYFTNWANYNKHMKRIHRRDTSSRVIGGQLSNVNNAALHPADIESDKSIVLVDDKQDEDSIDTVGTSQS